MDVDVKRLDELRTARGFSRRQLALKAGLSQNAVNAAVRRGSASPETLMKLAEELGVHPNELSIRPFQVTGRERFFEGQRYVAEHALESLRGAKQAVREGQLDYARRFLNLAEDAVRSIEQAQGEALKIERGQRVETEKGSDSRQASTDPAAPTSVAAQEHYESIPQT